MSKSVNPRDTQFTGFAKLLLQEMLAQTQWDGMDFNADDTEDVENYSLIIARRAYDLVVHTLIEVNRWETIKKIQIPDLTSDNIKDLDIWREPQHDNR